MQKKVIKSVKNPKGFMKSCNFSFVKCFKKKLSKSLKISICKKKIMKKSITIFWEISKEKTIIKSFTKSKGKNHQK